MSELNKSKLQFAAKITPDDVKAKIAKRNKAAKNSEKGPTEKAKVPDKEKDTAEKKKRMKAKPAEFPVEARINAYGFLGFKAGWLAALGWQKGMVIKISRNEDGSINIRKA